MPLTVKEILTTFPYKLPAKECAGMIYGRLVPYSRIWDVMDLFDKQGCRWAWAPLLPMVSNECAYCGRSLNSEVLKGRETCPSCAGPLDEALVRLQ